MKAKKEIESVNTPDGILARLCSKLNLALGIDNHRLKILIDRFVMKVFNGVQNTNSHYDKINTYNEIVKNRMTIKVLFKYFRIIDIKKVTIRITVVTRRDVEVSVEEEVNFFTMEPAVKEKTDQLPQPKGSGFHGVRSDE